MIGKVLGATFTFAVTWFIVLTLVGIAGSSNLVWGDGYQYGRVRVPGTATLELPARDDIRVAMAVNVVGRGNGTPDLPIPEGVQFTATPVSGGPAATVTPRVQATSNAASAGANTKRILWTLRVPTAGRYRVTTRGSLAPLGVNGQLWFGHDPPIPGRQLPLIALIVTTLLFAGAFGFVRARGRRSPSAAGDAPENA